MRGLGMPGVGVSGGGAADPDGVMPGLSPFPSEDEDPATPGSVVTVPRPGVVAKGGGLNPLMPNSVEPNGMPVPPTGEDALGMPGLSEVTPPLGAPSCA